MVKTLYVRRALKNVADLEAWAKAQKLKLKDGAHVTIGYSKQAIKWPRPAENPFFIPAAVEQKDGRRSIDTLGAGAVVLRFESTLLQDRWQQLCRLGATWDYDEYCPHITICYDEQALIDTNAIQPYLGPLVFGPEVFEEIRDRSMANDSMHTPCGGAGCEGCGGTGLAPVFTAPMKPRQGVAMDEAFKVLAAEISAQVTPAVALAFDRAPEGLEVKRPGIVVTLAFDKDSESVRRTDDFERLHVSRTPITKAGINPYYGREIPKAKELGLNADKVYKLLRHPDEIRKGASTFHNLPLLSEHVPHNADAHDGDITVGTTGSEAEYEHPYLYNSLAVWNREGIDHVERGSKKELSSAYSYDADMTPGTYEGEPYDGVMRNMVGNHVALVKKGRAGSDVVVGDEALQPQQENLPMATKLKSLKAGVALGSLRAHLLSPQVVKLAQDAAIADMSPVFAKIVPGKFKDSIPAILTGVKAALKGKLAQDSDLAGIVEGVQKLMASVDGDKTVEDASLDEVDPNAKELKEDTTMDSGLEAIKAYLKEKGVPDDVIAGLPGETTDEVVEDEFPKKDEDGKDDKDKDKPFDKGAMDAMLKQTETRTIARMNAVNSAREKVRPVVGVLDMAFDSAEGVYHQAFKMQGKDMSKVKDLGALEQMWSDVPVPGRKTQTTIAQDSESVGDFNKMFPNAAKVKRA